MNRQAPIIWQPQPRQRAFMERSEPEALYGGRPAEERATLW